MIGAVHGVCVQLFNAVVFVCGRLFELDPALVSLFHYSPNCGSTQDCLSSPEFLEHVTKVRRLHHSDRYNHTHTSHFFVLSCIVFLIFTPPGNAGDRRGGQPPGRPSLFGGLSVQPWQEAPGGRSQHAVIRSRILRLLLKLSKLSFAGGWSVTRLDFSFFISAGGGWVPPLHATVQPGTGLYWAAASGLAQHVQHRGGRHEPRVEPEWRGQGRLRRSAGAAEQLLWNRSAWLPRNEVV